MIEVAEKGVILPYIACKARYATCHYCGRQFVDMARYRGHIQFCMAEKQSQLDKEWRERQFDKESFA